MFHRLSAIAKKNHNNIKSLNHSLKKKKRNLRTKSKTIRRFSFLNSYADPVSKVSRSRWLIGKEILKRNKPSIEPLRFDKFGSRPRGWVNGAYLARFRNKQTNTNRTRSTDRFIVRLRGLNRAVEHQKYELRNDTVSKAVIRPRSNVETINPIPVKRINDAIPFNSDKEHAFVSSFYRLEFCDSYCLLSLIKFETNPIHENDLISQPKMFHFD